MLVSVLYQVVSERWALAAVEGLHHAGIPSPRDPKLTRQLWAILAVLTLMYFLFGNSISYQQATEAAYQAKYSTLKTQRDELIALERYWAIEVEGLKKEEQRQLIEKKKLEQRAEDLRERERYVAEQMRKESEAHTPFQENGPVYVKHILQTKCGVEALSNYTTMHRLRRLGNLKPSHLLLAMVEGPHSVVEKLATIANGFALSYQLNRAFFVDNSTFGSLFPLLSTVTIDWQSQPPAYIDRTLLDVRPSSAEQRDLSLQSGMQRKANLTADACILYATTPVGTLESLHTITQRINLPFAWHTEVGCMLHQLISPSPAVLARMRDSLSILGDPETFTVAIYVTQNQLLKAQPATRLDALFGCARSVVRHHALHGSRVRWFLVSDVKSPSIPEDMRPHTIHVTLGTDEADVIALYTLAYSRMRILTEGLLGRMGALLSLRFGSTYYLPANSKCGAEDTTRLDDLEFTYP